MKSHSYSGRGEIPGALLFELDVPVRNVYEIEKRLPFLIPDAFR